MANNSLLFNTILEGIFETKGEDVVHLNLEKVENAFCESFVICHANSNTQVSAIASSIEKKVKDELNIKVHHREGLDNSIWVLLVHVFQTEYREYYKLEELWGDALITKIEDRSNKSKND